MHDDQGRVIALPVVLEQRRRLRASVTARNPISHSHCSAATTLSSAIPQRLFQAGSIAVTLTIKEPRGISLALCGVTIGMAFSVGKK